MDMSETETLALIQKNLTALYPFIRPVHVTAVGQADAILAFQMATLLRSETSVTIKTVCTIDDDTYLTDVWLTIHDDGVVDYTWSRDEPKMYYGQVRPV